MSKQLKWFTCTPVRFNGNQGFFARDSGLMSCGLNDLGIESRAVMPGPPMADDDSRLIRTDYENLENPSWWASHRLDGVVLYSWADPKFTKVARAIKQAGIFLVINMDSAGVLSIWTDGFLYVTFRLRYSMFLRGRVKGFLHFCAGLARSMLIFPVDLPRLRHMQTADLIGAVTPLALTRIQRYAMWFGYRDVAGKVRLLHHPVASYTSYHAEDKGNVIVALGRWTQNDLVKRPRLLLAIIARLLSENADYHFEIVGRYDHILSGGIKALPIDHQRRIKLHGLLANHEVAKVLLRARISLCTSSNESFHIASAEALCAGCSVVGLRSPVIAFLKYAEELNCASLADRDQTEAYVNALQNEIALWQTHSRDPVKISAVWSSKLHAPAVAAEIMRQIPDLQNENAI
jgi:glycosyltransferase involved in cell wall biosynthesis